jgi:hypothetical protein
MVAAQLSRAKRGGRREGKIERGKKSPGESRQRRIFDLPPLVMSIAKKTKKKEEKANFSNHKSWSRKGVQPQSSGTVA